MVCEPVVFDGANVTSPVNASNPQPEGPCHTLSTDSRNYVVTKDPVFCLQGAGATSQNSQGMGYKDGASYTLNTTDVHGVAYLASGKETVGTLQANAGTKLWLGNQEAFSGDYHIIEKSDIRYIVRRLAPTECARLQGFADRWGDIDPKTEFSDAEYRFWLEVRNTHATVIGGKEAKEYTKEQMLKWYNSLHADSSEYKMWGNGIALPPALYVLQGITDALNAYVGEPIAEAVEETVEAVEAATVEEPAVVEVEEPVALPAVDPEKKKMRETLIDIAKVFGEMAQHIMEVCK